MNVYSQDDKKFSLVRNDEITIGPEQILRRRVSTWGARPLGDRIGTEGILGKKHWILLAAMFLLILAGIYFYTLPPPPLPTFNRENIASFSTAPEVDSTLPAEKFLQEGEKINLTISSDEYADGKWQFVIKFSFSYENLGKDKDGNEQYEVTLTEFESETDLENYGFEMTRRSVGWSYRCSLSDDGELQITTDKLMYPEVAKGIIVASLTYAPIGVMPDHSIKPGDEWTRKLNVTADYSEHLFYRLEEKMQFVEWLEHRNRLIAKVRRESKTSFGGITIPYKRDENFPSHTVVQTDANGEMIMYFDAETAELIGATREETREDHYKLTQERTYPEAMNSDAEIIDYEGSKKRSLISVGREPGMPH